MRTGINRTLQVGFLAAAFLGGFVVGSATHHNADAQLGDIGKKAMEEAGGAGGAAGSAPCPSSMTVSCAASDWPSSSLAWFYSTSSGAEHGTQRRRHWHSMGR